MNPTSLRIALIGATGGTGSLVLQQALDAGHQVTALVRDPSRLTTSHPALTVVEGSVLDADPVERTVAGADVVVCTLGAPPTSRDRVRERGTRVLVDAMRAVGVRRLVVQSSHGIGDTHDELPWVMRWLIVPLYLRRAFADHERQEEVVKAAGLQSTLVRPPHLSDDAPADALAFGPVFDPDRMTMKVSRADVARFLLMQATSPARRQETLVVSTATPTVSAAVDHGAMVRVPA